jgi:hypothetical protein
MTQNRRGAQEQRTNKSFNPAKRRMGPDRALNSVFSEADYRRLESFFNTSVAKAR